MVERRIKAAKFPATKSLDSFDFKAIPSLKKALTMELVRGEFIDRRENVIALGPSGTGKTHVALGLGLAACQKGLKVRFTTSAAIVHELIEAVDDRRLQRFQKVLAIQDLLIIDELGFVPPLQDWGRAAVRGHLPALRARLDHHHLQPALRRMDRGLRIGTPHRRDPRSPDPPRPHSRDERRELQAPPELQGQDLCSNSTGSHELAFGQCVLPRVSSLESAGAKAPATAPSCGISLRETGQFCAGLDKLRSAALPRAGHVLLRAERAQPSNILLVRPEGR